MSRRRSRTDRTARRQRRHGTLPALAPATRPGEEVPGLMDAVAAPLLAAFQGGQQVATCVHLDGLATLAELDGYGGGVGVWVPCLAQSLMCAECADMLSEGRLQLLAEGRDPGAACDSCGDRGQEMETYLRDSGDLLIFGGFCAACVADPPGGAA